ncbi:hypothetical protein [Bradyrhizobium cenepequi]|uniref:hypothetical protein n=1 Tax=Bradyrhizobium cenepequi TaxID=2821403 RepID=UPI001CE2CD96|nr:hypothetical protein [Bradyrhizobium cenepequi]MCA6107123.1 hypothetical protein [Bradyrhizobium cenepequi]
MTLVVPGFEQRLDALSRPRDVQLAKDVSMCGVACLRWKRQPVGTLVFLAECRTIKKEAVTVFKPVPLHPSMLCYVVSPLNPDAHSSVPEDGFGRSEASSRHRQRQVRLSWNLRTERMSRRSLRGTEDDVHRIKS